MKPKLASWATLIEEQRQEVNDASPLIHATLTAEELAVEFGNNYGGSRGRPFTAWSEHRVYFPVVYDGAEWVGSVPRNPCDEATRHQGGE